MKKSVIPQGKRKENSPGSPKDKMAQIIEIALGLDLPLLLTENLERERPEM